MAMIEGSFQGTDKQQLARLQNAVSKILAGMRAQLEREMIELTTYIVSEKLSGQVLHRRSGTLSDSVHPTPTVVDGNSVKGGVTAAEGPAYYGVYFEKGGKGPYQVSFAMNRARNVNGRFAKETAAVNQATNLVGKPGGGLRAMSQAYLNGMGSLQKTYMHPPTPHLPFMAPSLAENKDKIITNLRQAAFDALRS